MDVRYQLLFSKTTTLLEMLHCMETDMQVDSMRMIAMVLLDLYY